MDDLNLNRVKTVLGVAGQIAGGTIGAMAGGPPGAIVGTAIGCGIAAVAATADGELNKRSKREIEKTNRMVGMINQQIKEIQGTIEETELIDVYHELLVKATKEEDDRKEEIHAGILTFALLRSSNRTQVAQLGEAARVLSYEEIVMFIDWVKRDITPRDTEEVERASFWKRIEAQGLFSGGSIKYRNNTTRIGSLLAECCGHLTLVR